MQFNAKMSDIKFGALCQLLSQAEPLHTESTNDKEFACTICDFRTLSNIYLKKHLKRHTSLNRIKCEVCDTELSKEFIDKHMLIHTGEKKETCKICSKTGLTEHSTYTQYTYLITLPHLYKTGLTEYSAILYKTGLTEHST